MNKDNKRKETKSELFNGKKIRFGNKYKFTYFDGKENFGILTRAGKENLPKRQSKAVIFVSTEFGLMRLTEPVTINDSEYITLEELTVLFGSNINFDCKIDNYEGKITI